MESYLSNVLSAVHARAAAIMDQATHSSVGFVYCEEENAETVLGLVNLAVRSIIENEKTLSEVAARSHLHGEGAKLVLIQGTERVAETRIHFWGNVGNLPTYISSDINVHDHSAGFASLILAGTLEEEIHQRDIGSSGKRADPNFAEYQWRSSGEPPRYSMDCVGTVTLSCISRHTLEQKSWHALKYDVFHRIQSTSDRTITIFFQESRKQGGTHVFSPLGRPLAQPVTYPTLTFSQTKYILMEVLSAIGC